VSSGKSKVSPSSLIQAVDEKITAVRTQSIDLSFNELADMHAGGELIIDSGFQRMFRWSEGAQSRFIESLLLELPIPPIFLIEREDRVYELIDGLQRISSFLHFRGQLEMEIDGERLEPLVLSDCDILRELNGLAYTDLPRALEIKLKRSYMRAEILRKESDPRLRYFMFKRLHAGGESLSAQEFRNATIRLLSNDFNQFLMDMSRNNDFDSCIGAISEERRRQRFDQELVLRFFAFKNYFDRYRYNVADFLTDYMESVSDPTASITFDYVAERQVFEKTFRILRLISNQLTIDSKIFGTLSPRSLEPRGQFSVSHYDGLVLGLQGVLDRVDTSSADQIQHLASVVREGKADQDFLRHASAGINTRSALRERVNYFASRFEAALA
jgi:Protein of unknown function DUF262